MGIVISGKKLALSIKESLQEKIKRIKDKTGLTPHLVVIIVGNNPASLSYVRGKEAASLEVGIRNTTLYLPMDTTESDLLLLIDKLNHDDDVDGILVQLPLPKTINQGLVIEKIALEKDVDGFHPRNVYNLETKKKCIFPCTPKGIIRLLDSKNIPIEGQRAVVIGRSNIVGLPVAKMLLDRNATVTICHSRTKDLALVTKEADILIVAIGSPLFVKEEMVKEGAVVIDVGVNRVDDHLVGDVDFDYVRDKTSFITRVPGGVGPMTIAMLMENTLEVFMNRRNVGDTLD